jgi:hypothetical protein
MKIPCSTSPVTCPSGTDGDDALIANADIETPDVRMFFGYHFSLRSSRFCEAITQVAADLCAINPPDPETGTIYSSNAQTCNLACGSFTVPSGAALGFTQLQADESAYALACTYAAIVCSGGTITLVPNTAQTCAITCPDGSPASFTIPAGAVLGLTLAEANASAYATACQAAALTCPNQPPPPLFGNSAVSSTSDCPSGGTFTYHVAANTFFATSLDAANATAQSYADQQAVLDRSCLSDIEDHCCVTGDTFYSDVITTTLPGTVTWSFVSGSLPPGLTFSNGMITGTPVLAGVYSFTVLATSSNGNFTSRTVTIRAVQITTASPLPTATVGVAYSVTLNQTGAASPVWSGKPPPGLLLNSSTGVISGTATTIGSSSFTVTCQDGSELPSCAKSFSITVSAVPPLDWWQLDEAANGTRFGSVNAIPLICSASVTSVAGGKYGNATALNSTSPGSSQSCGNTAAPAAGMAYAGNGIDAFIWLAIDTASTSDTILLLNFSDSHGTTVWFMRFTIRNPTSITYDMTGGSSGAIALGSSAAYRLLEIWYNPSTARLGLRINDGAIMDQNIAVGPVPPVTVEGAVSITYDRITAGTSAANACELAVYPTILSVAQRAYIYNAGAGRTWPVTLP